MPLTSTITIKPVLQSLGSRTIASMLQLLKLVLCSKRGHGNEKPVAPQLDSSPCSTHLEKSLLSNKDQCSQK